MSNLREAAQQALDALGECGPEQSYAMGTAAEALTAALALPDARPVEFVVSTVLIKDALAGFNTQNKLYLVNASSRNQAHGIVLPMIAVDFPGYRLHTICSYALLPRNFDLAKLPDAEPVAWMLPSPEGYDSNFRDANSVVRSKATGATHWDEHGWIPLFTPPQPAA